jgi:hypothetical protein
MAMDAWFNDRILALRSRFNIGPPPHGFGGQALKLNIEIEIFYINLLIANPSSNVFIFYDKV